MLQSIRGEEFVFSALADADDMRLLFSVSKVLLLIKQVFADEDLGVISELVALYLITPADRLKLAGATLELPIPLSIDSDAGVVVVGE